MRIGTWNLNKQWSDRHLALLRGEECDVWLLTEVSPKAVNPEWKNADFYCHISKAKWCEQHWAAVLSRQPLIPIPPDPHEASAAATVNGTTYWSTVLPWSGCNTHPPHPWVGETLETMQRAAIEALTSRLPRSNFVWGGDWNQNLAGGWEHVGTIDGQALLKGTLEAFRLQVATAELLHRSGGHTIDHIAVPIEWSVTAACVVPAPGLSDHDAYVVEVHEK